MANGLVIYYSRSGNTKQMATLIADAMNGANLPTKCKSVSEIKVDDLLKADAIVVGSPTYYGHMAAEVKKMFDDAVSKHGRLDGIGEIVDVEHRHALDLGHFVEVEIVRHYLRTVGAGHGHQFAVHFPNVLGVVIDDKYVGLAVGLLHGFEDVEPAPPLRAP